MADETGFLNYKGENYISVPDLFVLLDAGAETIEGKNISASEAFKILKSTIAEAIAKAR
jgi:hypothetical protein